MSQTTDYFRGKHVLVTGGSSGIGLAVARQLVDCRASATLIARRGPALEKAKAEILDAHGNAEVHTLALDVSKENEVTERLSAHLARHPADMLINNAGIAMPGRFTELDGAHFREQMDVNYFGAVHMCRAVIPSLVARGGGHIANVGSLLSVMGVYGYSAYAASKFALYGFSEVLRAELWPHGITVSVVLPPDTDTPQHAFEIQHLPEETKALGGSVKMLSADKVAAALLDGMARRKFEIIPGIDGRFTVLANRVAPGFVRWVCDGIQKKASKKNGKRLLREHAHGA